MRALGVDIGSLTTKAVILDSDRIIASIVMATSDESEQSARAAISEVLNQAGLKQDNGVFIVATGVGGKDVSLSQQSKSLTTCLARGIYRLFPSARMSIDMGAESSTVIKINERGRLNDWVNQDKCAAGTGIFLQQMAKLMQMPLDEMARLSFQARGRAGITSTCAVFAESEVISHVHREPPTPKEDIIAGIYYSVVSRIISLCKRIGIERDVAVTGGVARNRGLVRILEDELGFGVLVPEEPQLVAALGAAIVAQESIDKGIGR
ncbi:MAG: 2-hydroxyglutaryl-CoA dehydratase [Dehalococcoidia bacterium]|nr:2-hydroxyglutaryl-CoA dehydratase [Dehalococcoidia bacterium]